MAVVVVTPESAEYASEEVVFPNATKWVIDNDRQLHVTGGSGNLASYASDQWVSVRQQDATQNPEATR